MRNNTQYISTITLLVSLYSVRLLTYQKRIIYMDLKEIAKKELIILHQITLFHMVIY